jgi:type I restriction enzyme R subunit
MVDNEIRRLVDEQVIGMDVRDPQGVYLVNEPGQNTPEKWSEEKTRNETDLIRTRLKRTIEQDLALDPYSQKVFSELLKQAIAEAEAQFAHPLKQYALLKLFEEKVEARQIEGIPQALNDKPHARAYYGVMRLALGEETFSEFDAAEVDTFVALALEIHHTVERSVAEYSLNPQSIEAEIRKGLLPELYKQFGLEQAKAIIEEVNRIVRAGLKSEAQ